MAYKDKEQLIKYNNDYNRQNYERISVLVKSGDREQIRAAADAQGESLNAYINKAIQMRMDAEQKQ